MKTVTAGTDWMGYAACHDEDPELFFPSQHRDDHPLVGSAAYAKRVCAGCLVRTQCLEYAQVTHARFGVWGGLTEYERARLVGRGRP